MALLALHVDPSGFIRDSNNNIVYLRGTNTAATEFGDGTGGSLTAARITALANTLNLNLIRVAINASWWNNNSAIPTGNTYQNWIATLIGWIEAANCYCEISCVTAFCTITGSPPQNFLDSCNSTGGVIDWDGKIFPVYNTFWTNFITTAIKNDPGVLYNLSNEPVVADAITQQKTLLATVRGKDANKLVVADSRNYNNVVQSIETDYVDSNLVIDWHIYDDSTFWWYQKLSSQVSADFGAAIAYAQAHGHGIMFGEFNVVETTTWNAAGQMRNWQSYALTKGAALAQYNLGNCLAGDNVTLLPSGVYLANTYAAIAAGPKAWFGT